MDLKKINKVKVNILNFFFFIFNPITGYKYFLSIIIE